MNNNCCTMYVVRHGETEWNVKKIMMGHKDSPLTDLGVEQAKSLGQALAYIKFDAAFSSDSTRAHRTAEMILLDKQLAITTSKLLREKSYGASEGHPLSNYVNSLREALGKKEELLTDEEEFKSKIGHGDESEEEATIRFISHLREIAAAYIGKTILVVTHGACIRLLLMSLGYGTRQELIGAVSNTAYVKLLADGTDFSIEETVGINKNTIKQDVLDAK